MAASFTKTLVARQLPTKRPPTNKLLVFNHPLPTLSVSACMHHTISHHNIDQASTARSTVWEGLGTRLQLCNLCDMYMNVQLFFNFYNLSLSKRMTTCTVYCIIRFRFNPATCMLVIRIWEYYLYSGYVYVDRECSSGFNVDTRPRGGKVNNWRNLDGCMLCLVWCLVMVSYAWRGNWNPWGDKCPPWI